FDEDFESGTLGQFVSGVATCVPGGCGWTAAPTPNSGVWAAFAPDVADVSDQRLTTANPISIPSDASSPDLTFYHNSPFDYSPGPKYLDGGVLEVSTDSGTTWLTATFITGGYRGVISSSYQNPLGGRSAWIGSQSTFVPVVVNLLPYAGQSVIFRFREGTDRQAGFTSGGWWIDNITATVSGGRTFPT